MFASTSPADLLASIGSVSSGVFDSVESYVFLAAGISVAFYIAGRLVSLIPKGRGR